MAAPPVLDPAVRRQIEGVMELAREALGDAAVAAYLYGSAVMGGLRADSDLDVLVIVDRETTDQERRALIEGLLARSRSREQRDRRHLEVTVLALPQIRPWRYPPPLELQYGDWWRAEFEAGDLSPWTSPNPDLAILLTSVRDDGVALFGAPARVVLPAVPTEDLQRALRHVIPELLPGLDAGDTRNALLTLARIWFTLEEGAITSKDAAAAWAIRGLPQGMGEALRLARSGYLGEDVDTWDAAARDGAHRDWDAMIAAIERT